MNSSDSHEPTAAFRAHLKREISRAARGDGMFGPPPSMARSRRVINAVGVAAGAALTLLAGMVLGASASYASAAVPDAPRPTFAFGPVKDALSAIGCGVAKVATQSPHRSQTPPPAAPARPAVGESDTAPPAVPSSDPNRTRIAALVTQHQPLVVRGDTASEYVVVVVDASENYVWSTHGSGGLSIEVAGDTRTPSQRREYARQFATEFGDGARFPIAKWFFSRDSLPPAYLRMLTDSLVKRQKIRKAVIGDSLFSAYFRMKGDSLAAIRVGQRGDRRRDVAIDSFVASAGRGGGGRGNGAQADTAGTYRAGWSGVRNRSSMNRAHGLDAVGAGDGHSGITGLASVSVTKADLYFFAAGQLAPQDLNVMVVQLTDGAVWSGR